MGIVKAKQGIVVDAGMCWPTSSFRTEELIPLATGSGTGTQPWAVSPLWKYPG